MEMSCNTLHNCHSSNTYTLLTQTLAPYLHQTLTNTNSCPLPIPNSDILIQTLAPYLHQTLLNIYKLLPLAYTKLKHAHTNSCPILTPNSNEHIQTLAPYLYQTQTYSYKLLPHTYTKL